MAQLISPIAGAAHQAPVRSPFALPVDRHWSLGPVTRIWPVALRPFAPPSNRTSVSRATIPLARGQGCPVRHEPSISRAAIPASRIRGPSRHQIGPSPSQTLIGVQVNDWPPCTTATASRNTASISAQPGQGCKSCFREKRLCIRPRGGLVGEDVVAAQPHCQVSRQLRRCTASCNGIATPNIGDEGRFGSGERHLEVEGQTVFIDSEHGCRIEQRKNNYQVSRSSEPSIIAWVTPAMTGHRPASPTAC